MKFTTTVPPTSAASSREVEGGSPRDPSAGPFTIGDYRGSAPLSSANGNTPFPDSLANLKFPSLKTGAGESQPLRKAAGAESLSLDQVGLSRVQSSDGKNGALPTPEASIGVGGVGGGSWYRPPPGGYTPGAAGPGRPFALPGSRPKEVPRSETPANDFASLMGASSATNWSQLAPSCAAEQSSRLRNLTAREITELAALIAQRDSDRRLHELYDPRPLMAELLPRPLPANPAPPKEEEKLGVSGVTSGGMSADTGRDRGRNRGGEGGEREQDEREGEADSQGSFAALLSLLPEHLRTGDTLTDTLAQARVTRALKTVRDQLAVGGETVETSPSAHLEGLWRAALDAEQLRLSAAQSAAIRAMRP